MPQFDRRGYTLVQPQPARSVSTDSSSEDSMERHDIQTAVKRNLRIWVQWRVDVNGSLVKSMGTGQRMDNVAPLRTYLKSSVPHATDNPKTLLAYSAAIDNISQLNRGTFLSYGIPRVKMPPGRVPSIVEPQPDYPEADDDGDYDIDEYYDDVIPSAAQLHPVVSGRTGTGSGDIHEQYVYGTSSQGQEWRHGSASSNGLTPPNTSGSKHY